MNARQFIEAYLAYMANAKTLPKDEWMEPYILIRVLRNSSEFWMPDCGVSMLEIKKVDVWLRAKGEYISNLVGYSPSAHDVVLLGIIIYEVNKTGIYYGEWGLTASAYSTR